MPSAVEVARMRRPRKLVNRKTTRIKKIIEPNEIRL